MIDGLPGAVATAVAGLVLAVLLAVWAAVAVVALAAVTGAGRLTDAVRRVGKRPDQPAGPPGWAAR